MSRESDSSSSGPQGRGGAAYPSGTPPYGSPRGEAGDTPASDAAAQPEEPKTETTLTTRIKINIPGSRPIPPVVVRKPVGEEPGMNGSAGSGGSAPGSPSTPRSGERNAERTANTPRPEAPANEAPAGGQKPGKTSDWFAPRKPQGGAGAGSSSSTGSHAAPPAPGGATPPSGATPPRGPAGATPPQRPDLPYFSDSPAPQEGGSPFDGGTRPGGGSPFDGGPRTGASSFDGATPGSGTPFDTPDAPARDHSPFDSPAAGPSGPTTGPARGSSALNLPPGFSDSGTGSTPRIDDTAELTPQPPAPPAGPGGGVTGGLPTAPKGGRGPKGAAAGRDRVSGDTLVSGIPKIPGEEKPPSPSAFAQAPAGEGDSAAPKPRPKIPEPINPPKSGRNKFVLLGVAVVVLAGFAYGAGLLLDHADVPNGTTALGVDIGGKTKEEAVAKLEKALKDSRTAPIKLSVDGKSVTLRPAKAGLDIDPQATVRKAAGRDYNPVSVIGSLVGVHRTAEPEVIVDDEKLQIALENATGPGGATEDGGITFEGGKAVAHYGAPHKAIDVAASKKKVADAYRKRAVSGTDAPVVLAAGTRQPQVSKAAVDRAMQQFARPAMSGLVTVRTDAAHTVSFSPQKSIPKFLSFKIVSGSLVPYYDRPALKELYGDTFNGVMVTKGDGSKHPVSVEEVASAVGKALQGTSPAERVQTIATNGN